MKNLKECKEYNSVDERTRQDGLFLTATFSFPELVVAPSSILNKKAVLYRVSGRSEGKIGQQPKFRETHGGCQFDPFWRPLDKMDYFFKFVNV